MGGRLVKISYTMSGKENNSVSDLGDAEDHNQNQDVTERVSGVEEGGAVASSSSFMSSSSSSHSGDSKESKSSSSGKKRNKKRESFFKSRKWPRPKVISKEETVPKKTSCICTSYRKTNSDPEAPSTSNSSPRFARCVAPNSFHGPIIDLSKFDPAQYPIEDPEEIMRQRRAKEIQEGVELSTQNFGKLNLKDRSAHSQVDYIHCLVPDLKEITNCSFYWGKIDRYEAEKLLEGRPEGTFLLRDSAQEDYLFSVSFRRYGRSLHARIEQWNHQFSFDSHDPSVYASKTVTGLILHYKDPSCCMFFEPMLTTPLHRTNPFDLQHLARSVICSRLTYDDISQLSLPKTMKTYCKEYHYKQKFKVRNFD